MKRGKSICNQLKSVRQAIADANGIAYTPAVCNHKGDCPGTCPACEAEVQYLEHELSLRSIAGKAVAVAGIAAALTFTTPAAQAAPQTDAEHQECNHQERAEKRAVEWENTTPATSDSITVEGTILDENNDPAIGAVVMIQTHPTCAVCTDLDGHFSIKVPQGCTLATKFIGYYNQVIELPKQSQYNLRIKDPIVLSVNDETVTTGIVITSYPAPKKKSTGVISPITTPKREETKAK